MKKINYLVSCHMITGETYDLSLLKKTEGYTLNGNKGTLNICDSLKSSKCGDSKTGIYAA